MTSEPQQCQSIEDAAEVLISSDNRRKHERSVFDVRLLVHELDESGSPGPGCVCDGYDISRSGMGLRSRRLYYKGGKVIVQILLRNQQPRYLCGEVKYSRYRSGGPYHVGIEFCALPDTVAFQAWQREQQQKPRKGG